ncbi:E3 ubiquitin-protein ligase rnf213-alpha [Erpetoichthys calabaricus]|uniref:E3 ubiquitin-protein ligase rnf213-alpha n=1 Tax=Erpetoichthys calabaricus TaxID=27687 RepID=UPI0022348858|nr:E3 ubiquitin-protein ligase rnf213-alpha [Erpetoichthys calabaricus]
MEDDSELGDNLSADVKNVKQFKDQMRPSEDKNENRRSMKKKKKKREKVNTEEHLSVAGDRNSSDFSDDTQVETASNLEDISLETVKEKKDLENNVLNPLESIDKESSANNSENHDIQIDEKTQLNLESGVESVCKRMLKFENEVKDSCKDVKIGEDNNKNLLTTKSEDQSASDCLHNFQQSESKPMSAPVDSPACSGHVQEKNCSMVKKNHDQVMEDFINVNPSPAEKSKSTEPELTTATSTTMKQSTEAKPKKDPQLKAGKNKGEKEREDDSIPENQRLPEKCKNPDQNSTKMKQDTQTKENTDPHLSEERNKGIKQLAADSLQQSKKQTADSSPAPDAPISAANEGHKKDTNLKSHSSKTSEKPKNLKPPAISERLSQQQLQQIPPDEKITIYFHAVLSKDFNFDQSQDKIFLRAGNPIGNWDENLAEINVVRDRGECGFLVEGHLIASKTNVNVSIPYKYAIYKWEKKELQYEIIHNNDAKGIVNRCLLIKEDLLGDRERFLYQVLNSSDYSVTGNNALMAPTPCQWD